MNSFQNRSAANFHGRLSPASVDLSPRGPAGVWLPIVIIWLLVLTTFSMPGREGPSFVGSMDWIALSKAATRMLAVASVVFAIGYVWDGARVRTALWYFLPLGAFAAWAVVSALWSALPAVSVGQALGLIAQLLLAVSLAAVCRTQRHCSAILFHLSMSLTVVATILVAAHFVDSGLSGLDRTTDIEGSTGLVHPTSAGATASLGIVIALGAYLIWGWPWSRGLLPYCVAVHAVLLLLANSRMALAMALLTAGVMLFTLGHRRVLCMGAVAASLLGVLYLVLDPGMLMAETALLSVVGFARRGESLHLLFSLTGRTELWEAIWESIQRSPWIGHGYFVTSWNGLLNVWSGPANRTAHNILLQVLVSTGIVGTLLFLWGMFRPLTLLLPSFARSHSQRAVVLFALPMGLWYFGWGQLCESFMGPVQPESVVFYSVLGLIVGTLAPSEVDPSSRLSQPAWPNRRRAVAT